MGDARHQTRWLTSWEVPALLPWDAAPHSGAQRLPVAREPRALVDSRLHTLAGLSFLFHFEALSTLALDFLSVTHWASSVSGVPFSRSADVTLLCPSCKCGLSGPCCAWSQKLTSHTWRLPKKWHSLFPRILETPRRGPAAPQTGPGAEPHPFQRPPGTESLRAAGIRGEGGERLMGRREAFLDRKQLWVWNTSLI